MSNAIIGRSGVEPEHAILDQVDEDNAGNVPKGQHTICATGAVFDGPDYVTLNAQCWGHDDHKLQWC